MATPGDEAPKFGLLLEKSGYLVSPWKNGRGQSAQIAIFPEGSAFPADPFLWRLSTAHVTEAGPFSEFHGYDRLLTLVSGEALKLKFSKDGSEILVKKGEVCRFPGEEPISSELLSGAVTDLNLIFKRGQVNAEAQVLKLPSKPKSIQLEGGVSFLFAISGSLAISIYPGEEEFVLKEGDTLRIIGPARGEERLVLLEPKKRDSLVALIELELKS